MGQTTRLSKAARKRIADERKAALIARRHTYSDLARLADVTYSMVDKWMNARRTSKVCQRAFDTLTAAREKAS
jgi:hypothetical protein